MDDIRVNIPENAAGILDTGASYNFEDCDRVAELESYKGCGATLCEHGDFGY